MSHESESPRKDTEKHRSSFSAMFPDREISHPDGPRFLAAIKAGDLETVRRMVQSNRDLVFVRDDDYRNAVSVAEDTHPDMAVCLARVELQRLREGSVPESLLDVAIHDLGEAAHSMKGLFCGCEELRVEAEKLRVEAEPVVAAFLTHDEPEIRYIAISVLGLHWDMPHYVPVFQQMCQNDPEEPVRHMAVTAVGWLRRGSRDRDAARFLVGILRNPGFQPAWIREDAYDALVELWYGTDEAFAQRNRMDEKERVLRAAAEQAGTAGEGAQSGQSSRNLWEECADWDFVARVEQELRAEGGP